MNVPDLLLADADATPLLAGALDSCPPPSAQAAVELESINQLNAQVERRFRDRLTIDPCLTRSLVSFQANKTRPIYRWFKYKEAFSAGLVEYLFRKYHLAGSTLLDPFAGSGTTLFVAASLGSEAEGVELLPVGQKIIATKKLIDSELIPEDIAAMRRWIRDRPWTRIETAPPLNELRITRSAYPPETKAALEKYLVACAPENERVGTILLFAALCVLENISYTRKDGQYLRWDCRSGRRQGLKFFSKGPLPTFEQAISEKLQEMAADLEASDLSPDLRAGVRSPAGVLLHRGSCLEILPRRPSASYDCILTSPPYCNRYDYTRSYALELALLGVDEAGLVELRQRMLSCTVENRAKALLELNPAWESALAATDSQSLLQSILAYLDSHREMELLNNNGIPRMVRGYFYEMACVIAECARVLKAGGPLIMVNDNVRYQGLSVSVDLILSDIAEQLGFKVESILVLPNGKGNSSQQMSAHGRNPLRKCVYVWRKR